MPFIYGESACCDFDNPSSTCIPPGEAWARSTVHALERSARRRLQARRRRGKIPLYPLCLMG